jgi:hypothetical protein
MSDQALRNVLRICGTAITIAAGYAGGVHTWQDALQLIVSALGGAIAGTAALGPGMVHVDKLPQPLQAAVIESVKPPPPTQS